MTSRPLQTSLGKFIAPGCECSVVSMTIERGPHLRGGSVRLDRRPYWEGGLTPVRIELDKTESRIAMTFTALMVERGDFDGEGCDVDLEMVELVPPVIGGLDEQTHGEDLDWGEVRSACAERDWRRAWKAVGTDHEGDATPGEIYIFGASRRVSAVSAALRHWYLESLGLSGFGGRDQTWKDRYARIKVIASWESSAAAQHVSKAARDSGLNCTTGAWSESRATRFSMTVNGRPIEMFTPREAVYFDEAGPFSREQWATPEPDTSPLEDLIRAVNQPRMSGTVVMSQDTARALRNLPQLRAETALGADPLDGLRHVTDAMAGQQIFVVPNDFITTNPNPRGPAQRKRRGR